MKAPIRHMGNSQGASPQKKLAPEIRHGDVVHLHGKTPSIEVRKPTKLRKGWTNAARHMHNGEEDHLLDQVTLS